MKKKMHIYNFCFMSLAVLFGCTFEEDVNNTNNKKPNIVLFLVDDLGWQDTSVPFYDTVTHFNQTYHTPSMQRLASEGMKFTQAYATPVCSPTRISLMTGMNAARHRVTNWTLRKNTPTDRKHEFLIFPEWNMNGLSFRDSVLLSVKATPLPYLLQSNGYFTIHVGKAHLGAIGTEGSDPVNLGFDVNIAGHAAGAPASYYGTDHFGNLTEGQEVWAVPGLEEFHGQNINLTEALTQKALQNMDSARENKQPFFLYMSHYTVHAPIREDHKFFQKYLTAGMDTIEARYASMIEGMDKSLGDIMDYLKKHELEEETIVIFMSDNGGLSAHARGGQPHTHNWPLNSGKGSSYEGGIREPMIVKWPGKTEPGSTTQTPVIIEDFYPTLLEMAGIKNPEILQEIDGLSFVSVLNHNDSINQERSENRDRPLIWHYPNLWGGQGPGIGSFSAIRKGDWKLIYFHEDRHFELYNIPKDISESQNMASHEPETVELLAKELSDLLRERSAQMPFDTRGSVVVPWPDGKLE